MHIRDVYQIACSISVSCSDPKRKNQHFIACVIYIQTIRHRVIKHAVYAYFWRYMYTGYIPIVHLLVYKRECSVSFTSIGFRAKAIYTNRSTSVWSDIVLGVMPRRRIRRSSVLGLRSFILPQQQQLIGSGEKLTSRRYVYKQGEVTVMCVVTDDPSRPGPARPLSRTSFLTHRRLQTSEKLL